MKNRFMPLHRSDQSALAPLLQQWQDLSFLTSGIHIRPFQADFTLACTQGWGAYMQDFQVSGTWIHSDHRLHINCLELKVLILSLHHWTCARATRLRLVVQLFLWLQSQNIVIRARNIPGCLNIPILAKSTIIDRVESPFRDCNPNLRDVGFSNSGHVCHNSQISPSSVHVSNSGASSIGDR